ncbi:hypothetical protein Tco_1414875 [Tanacetum coccineum]
MMSSEEDLLISATFMCLGVLCIFIITETTQKSLMKRLMMNSSLEEVKESGLESIEDVTFDQIMYEIDQKNKAAEKPESSFNIKSEIKIIKRFQPTQPDDDAQFTFLGVEPYHFEYDHTNSTKLGFETPEFADNDSHEGTAKTFNASVDMPAQSDPLGHLHEELRILNTKVDQLESRISKKVTYDVQSYVPSIVVDALKANLPHLLSEALKNTLPRLIKDSIKQSVSESIEDKLPLFDAQVQQTLQDQLPNIFLKPMNKEFNEFNTMESHRNKVRKEMQAVSDKLASVQFTVATNSQHVQDLRSMYKDMVFLLEAAKVFKKDNAEREKWEKNNPKTPIEEDPDQP